MPYDLEYASGSSLRRQQRQRAALSGVETVGYAKLPQPKPSALGRLKNTANAAARGWDSFNRTGNELFGENSFLGRGANAMVGNMGASRNSYKRKTRKMRRRQPPRGGLNFNTGIEGLI